MAVDDQGHVGIAGEFSGSVDFGTSNLVSQAGTDGFVTKLDSAGNVLWTHQITGNSYDSATAVTVDHSGQSTAVGAFQAGDAVIMKLDNAGFALWTNRLTGEGFKQITGLAFDATGGSSRWAISRAAMCSALD